MIYMFIILLKNYVRIKKLIYIYKYIMKILVTGGTGLVGFSIQNIAYKFPNYEFIFASSKNANLTNYNDTFDFFNKHKPDFVIHLAACVGGLFKNMNHKVSMLEKNLMINYNVLKCCYEFKVKKCVSCLSTCIFPDKTSYPINETMLHDGPPHNSNYAYAYAKRFLEIQSRTYNEQYNTNFVCVIPTNVYGEKDNYSLTDGHVIPALIHRCKICKDNNEPFVVKGTGKPLRQFIYSYDLADLMMWTLFEYNDKDPIILSVDENNEVSIGSVATKIAQEFNYADKIVFDTKFSDGQYKKTADNSKLRSYLPKYKFTALDKGIKKSVKWFIDNFDTCRK
jgi:GDP-L-fucose synthase